MSGENKESKGLTAQSSSKHADTRMNLWHTQRQYIAKLVSQPGMKALLLDEHTVRLLASHTHTEQ
jgi:hypothetical protein